MAPKNKASVGPPGKHRKRDIEEGDDNNIAASRRFKFQMVLGLLSFGCFFLSFHFFDKGNVRESDPTKFDLMLVYSAYIMPPLVFTMSCSRRCLATNHPIWCFVVEMFQASLSSLTMTGSIQISIIKDEEENFLYCLGFLLASLILFEITIDDTEDCGVCDMLLALFLTKLNTKHPKYVPSVSATSYFSRKIHTFRMKKLKNERAEAKKEEAEELRKAEERMDKDKLKDMAECWVATKAKLATGPPESDLKMKYAEFFRMRVLIHAMNARARVD